MGTEDATKQYFVMAVTSMVLALLPSNAYLATRLLLSRLTTRPPSTAPATASSVPTNRFRSTAAWATIPATATPTYATTSAIDRSRSHAHPPHRAKRVGHPRAASSTRHVATTGPPRFAFRKSLHLRYSAGAAGVNSITSAAITDINCCWFLSAPNEEPTKIVLISPSAPVYI
jgi:hypothetical protein